MGNASASDTPLTFDDRSGCPLCGSSASTVYRAFQEIPVLRCTGCQFLYSGRIMPAGQLASYYQKDFGSDRHRKGQIVNAATNVRVLASVMDLAKAKRWLDVGTGYGFLLAALRDRFSVEASGVELSESEAAFARENLALNVTSSLNDSSIAKRSFDVVSCFEVIEHIALPVSFLQGLMEYVRPGGYLIIMTDNFESAPVNKLAGGFPKWIPHTHISHFSAQTLRKCIGQCGGLRLEKEYSYTPPDLIGRCMLSSFRKPPLDEDAFDLRATLQTEMNRGYRFFGFRNWLNPLWARLTGSRSAERGELMYMVCRVLP